LLARRVPLLVLTTIFSLTAWAQTNTAAGAGTYPAQPEPNSTASLGVRPEVLPWDTGEAGLHLLAKKLKNTGRIMHLTAHPDDEDGALLTYLSRGQGRQVLLMSLTRGEGGQNRTGSNLWDELGVLRTLELLESTRYYGTELRFSRVADFGFSKSADETFQKWGGHQVPLRDIVYVIREWKPDVLFTRFSGTPRDGHGMHQASAILAPEAVKCAADPNCFPDQLKGDHALTTWQVLKLYMGNQGGDYTVRYDVSQIDPDTKLSYTQMALEGFKHQASQLSGNFTPPSGPNWRSYKLISTSIPNYKAAKEQDFFDGITGWQDTARADEEILADLSKADALTTDGLKTSNPELLLQVRQLLAGAAVKIGTKRDYRTRSWRALQRDLGPKSDVAYQIAAELAKLQMRAEKNPDFLIPGEKTQARLTIRNGGATPIRVTSTNVFYRRDLTFLPLQQQKLSIAPNVVQPVDVRFSVDASTPLSVQHWHRRDPEKDTTYTYDNPRDTTKAIAHRGFDALLLYEYGKTQGALSNPVESTDVKHSFVPVLPALSVFFSDVRSVRSLSNPAFDATIRLDSVAAQGQGVLRVTVPAGWQVSPAAQNVELQPGKATEAKIHIVPPATSGRTELQAQVSFSKMNYASGVTPITREDLERLYYEQPAIQRVSIVDVNVPKNLRVGYIPGAGDDIFPVLQQLGLNAKQISNDELAKGDLHQYDTIVVGIRGYDERPEIRANNQRLLDFVNDGGTLLVQNQKDELLFNSSKFTPYPATLGRQRVSVEEAPVTVLAPNDSIFNSPNKITQGDFDGWVQERGINFMSDWDAKFEPLLASNDPGEQPLKGGLLRAKYGKGTYIYTGYAFFRQLPAGVPGAVRLYVNLLNAGHEAK
jgi:LmbE family N-acetylglucosaminyl deacetylase